MKKILALVLALCLTLSLSVVAFASSPSVSPEPSPEIPGPSTPSGGTSKYDYGATGPNGEVLQVNVDFMDAGSVYEEVKGYTPRGVYALSIRSAVDGNVTFDVYAPGASASDVVIVRVGNKWQVLDGANLRVSGARAYFTVPAEMVRQYMYFAIVKSFNTVDVEVPGQGTDQDGENEGEGDEMSAGDTDTETPTEGEGTTEPEQTTTPAPSESENPPTGVVLAVVPMVVAAAAIVISKKR